LNIRLTKHILPVLGKRRASSITGADIKKFVAKRQGEGASNGAINREMGHIRRAFVLGVQNGKILTRPYVAMLKENTVRTGFFEWEQCLGLLRHLPSGLHGPVTFAYITGWRIYSEILPLQWRHVDFAAGRVRLDAGTTKNDDAREFPMTRQLRELLERLKADHEALAKEGRICPWVFQRKGKPIKGFRKAWKSATRDAGIPGRLLHDFRRTAVRNLVRAGIPERVAMTMTGHKTRSVFERYNIVSDGDLLAAAERLERSTGTIPGTTASEAETEKAVSSSISTCARSSAG
jgi:integrase